MRRSIRGSRSLARPYRDLVWLAYLVLPPSAGEERRLVLAHRLAAAGLARHRGRDPIRLRQTVLRRALRARIPPWSGRFARLEVVPAVTRGTDAAFTGELMALRPAARAAYALLRLEGRPAGEVARILAGARVADPDGALAEVAALEGRFGDGAAAMFRPSSDPTLARCYGRLPGGRPRAGLVAGVAAAALAAAVAVPLLPGTPGVVAVGVADERAGAPAAVSAAPGAWRRGTELDLSTWEPRGALTGDAALVARALRAWGRRTGQLLYAGRVDGAAVVLARDGEQVARYTEAGGPGRLEVFPAPRARPGGAAPLTLRVTPAGSRYLLPPWVRELSAAPLSGPSPAWRPVRIEDGVSAPVRAAGGRCLRGPVLRLRAPEIAPGLPYTVLDLGGLSPAEARYRPPAGHGPGTVDGTPGGFGVWKGLGCAVAWPGGGAEAATAWEFWRGALPEGARGRWVCLRLADARGGNVVRGVLFTTRDGRTSAQLTGGRSGTWDCSGLRRDVVAGAWWRAPSGRHYYVAAGSRRVTRIVLDGRATPGTYAVTRAPAPALSAAGEPGEEVAVLR
ncbi:hypothetical protein Nocox_19265 [Nonomuraea coxensis DSM 45129]|uniref:DNA-directed RNA polymerase specialized sigma24 family protein n=1 Tax=Nonomuraea coxensis DSM 45129 TaxID=1122611 RepID=A0ABX8U126_9ACTN|nr:hypothetical protein [Nonomuraea coxensis]QYC41462.1 hypothetical protein Nocox_19265 [Nonomuraea coxensis DSM 45129]